MGGASSSTARSEQDVSSIVSTNMKSACSYVCENHMRKVNIDGEGSIGATILVGQKCVANANCDILSSADVITDIALKTKNSADAEAKQGLSVFDLNKSVVESVQKTRQQTYTDITNSCDVKAINDMEDITVNVKGSIGANVTLEQSALAEGDCKMKTAATVTNNLTSDSANKSVAGGKSSKMNMIMWIVFAVVLMAFAGIFAKLLSKPSNSSGGDIGLMKSVITALASSKLGSSVKTT